MAVSARTVMPFDLLALVSYKDKVYPNEARPRERIGAADPTPNAIETAVEQWFSFATRRNAWISARRQRLLGLVSARRRGGRRAWEIDCLIDTTARMDAVPGLLECAIRAGGKAGAEKIFLRLGADSPLLPVVMSAGFTAYALERLYVGSSLALRPAELPVRPFTQQDLYPAFRLYSSVVAERTRWAEAATFGEWQAAQETQWLKGGVRLAMDGSGALAAYAGAARLPHGIQTEVVAGQEALEVTDGLLAAAVGSVGPGGPVMVLLPEWATGIARRLEELGFEGRQDFASLVCRTTRLARLPKLVPAAIPNGAVIT